MKTKKNTAFLKLPFQFDEEMLVNDLNRLLQSKWNPHFNQDGYTGSWNSMALYAEDGNPNNIVPTLNNDAPNIETPIIKNCEYLKKVISNFECPLLSVRLLRLSPESHIKPHRDFNLGYEDNCFRLHIPITTNPEVTFTLDNHNIEMLPGECWYTNVNYIHSVSNLGSTDRVHLVIDGQRNKWSDDIFFSLAPKESLLPIENQEYDSTTISQMIAELESQDSEGARLLIEELRSKH